MRKQIFSIITSFSILSNIAAFFPAIKAAALNNEDGSPITSETYNAEKGDSIVSNDIICNRLPGDVNMDGKVNIYDAVALNQYLVNYPVTVDLAACDTNGDGKINLDDVIRLQQYIAKQTLEIFYTASDNSRIKYTKQKYGISEMGRDLEYYSFEPDNYSRTILLNFAIHGFEDEYYADAQVLVDTANQLIDYYNENFDKLKNTRLIIVPCANPDGLLDGTTNNGFGRCNANGVDLNRDFDANYKSYTSPRNYTQSPFSASESRALRDLVLFAKPEITIDFHGWENCTIGNYNIAKVFSEEMGLNHSSDFGTTNASGYFSNWAYQQGSAGLLVEFTRSDSISLTNLENAINRLLAGEYNKLEKDERFAGFEKLNSYTLSTERVTTYRFINEPYPSASYIDGLVDNCIILEVYKNGWLKVQYPITNGNKVAYARLWNFTDIDTMKSPFERLSIASNMTVYKRSDLSEKYGSVYTTDEAYIINDTNNAYQIIYELDAGGWKMGWISK